MKIMAGNRKRSYIAYVALVVVGVGLGLFLAACSSGSGASGHCWIQAADGNDTLAISAHIGDCSALAAAVQSEIRDVPAEDNATAIVLSPPGNLPPSHCGGTVRGHRITVYNLGNAGPSMMLAALGLTGCSG